MLTLFKHFISDRKKQLENQEKIDSSLEKLNKKGEDGRLVSRCPEVLIEFFLIERSINRKQCYNVHNSNIWEYPDIISDNMEKLEKRNTQILNILNSKDICLNLQKFNRNKN